MNEKITQIGWHTVIETTEEPRATCPIPAIAPKIGATRSDSRTSEAGLSDRRRSLLCLILNRTQRMMNKMYLLLFLLSIWGIDQSAAQGCLPSGITFTTQAELDAFPANYPGCSHILGDVRIEEANSGLILQLDSLSQLDSIGGFLMVRSNDSLANLSGLDQLTAVGGDLYVDFNHSLDKLDSLSSLSLTSIGGNLDVSSNNSLTNLIDFSHLASLGGSLYLDFGVLTSLSGLEQLTAISGDVQVSYNTSLTSLNGLNQLTSIGGDLHLQDNLFLPNLNGLDSLTSIDGSLYLGSNLFLASLNGLNQLSTIGGKFSVIDNSSLTSLSGLDRLTSVGENVRVSSNVSLTSLSGLDHLTTIGGSLTLRSNIALTSLSALAGLSAIGGELVVHTNRFLTNLHGLENIDPSTIADLRLFNSAQLSSCEVSSICDYLAISANPYNISKNMTGCDSRSEVLAACASVGLEDPVRLAIQLFPNPTTGKIEIQGPTQGQVRVTNQLGQVVAQQSLLPSTLDLSALPSGLYFLQIQSGDQRATKPILKR